MSQEDKFSQDFSEFDSYQFGHHDKVKHIASTGKGISRDVVTRISELKNEPGWMTDIRLKAYEVFEKKHSCPTRTYFARPPQPRRDENLNLKKQKKVIIFF